MTKRQKLNYDNIDLVQNLKESTGKGVDAFFTSPSPTPPTMPVENEPVVEDSINQDENMHPPIHAPKQTHIDARMHALIPIEKKLQKVILAKKHLSSFAFRFQSKELEELDEVTVEINAGADQKVSKNDIVRLAVNWLLKDYEEKKDKSMLAKVLRPT